MHRRNWHRCVCALRLDLFVYQYDVGGVDLLVTVHVGGILIEAVGLLAEDMLSRQIHIRLIHLAVPVHVALGIDRQIIRHIARLVGLVPVKPSGDGGRTVIQRRHLVHTGTGTVCKVYILPLSRNFSLINQFFITIGLFCSIGAKCALDYQIDFTTK